MHIGARLPFEGEALEEVVRMFSPVEHWLAQTREVLVPVVGVTGAIAPEPEPEPELKKVSPPTQPSGEIPVTET